MKNSKPKNKSFLLALLLGFTAAILLIMAAGAIFYQLSSENTKGKIRYVINQGKDYVKLYSKNKIADIPKAVKKTDYNKKQYNLSLNIDANHAIRKINPFIYGSNLAGKVEFEMDVAKFGKDIGITNLRFPGGGSPGYRWKLGTYDFSNRADNAPLSEIDNVIKFCKLIGAKLVIQVNIESGTPKEAAEWVEYMNKGQGMRVDYWELGNEVYGDWDKAYMSGKEYAKVIKSYSTLMKQVDPTINIGANWGGPRYQEFDETIIKEAADYVDFVSYHWYPNHINASHKYKGRVHPLAEEIMANALAVGKIVNRFEQMVKDYAPQRNGKIEFTVMEWDGSWDMVPTDINYEYRGMMWSLANAIFYADALGQFALHGITVANHYTFQEVSFGMIRGWDVDAGWGGIPWDRETIRPKALAFQLYAKHFGDILIKSTLTGSPYYDKKADWRPDSHTGEVPYVASYASKSAENDEISIVLINKHEEKDFKINISVNNVNVQSTGDVWILTGPNLKAQNDGSPEVVGVKKYDLTGLENKFSYNISARSVNLLKIPLMNVN